jgi:uncharacterized protein YlxW (UPF0749 family)
MTTIVERLRRIPSWQVTLGIALLALGFLIAAQLAAEGPRIRYTTQERSPLVETALQLQQQQADLKARIVKLRDDISDVEAQGAGSAAVVKELNDRLQESRIAAGLIPLEGTGIVLKLEDSTQPVPPNGNEADYLVSAADIRTVLGQLFMAGAEAISVNDERVTTSTAVIDIGGSVLVNTAYLAGPYEIRAIGANDLFTRLSALPGWAEFVQTRGGSFGIGVSWAQPETVVVPAFAGSVNLQESRAVPAASAPAPATTAPSP